MFRIDLFIEELRGHKYLGTRVYFSNPEKNGVHLSSSCANNVPPNFLSKLSRKDRDVLFQIISSSIEMCMQDLLTRREVVK